MARDFTKNIANYLTLGVDAIGALIDGASAISVACWTTYDTIDASAGGNFIWRNGSGVGAANTINLDGTGSGRLRIVGHSVVADAGQVALGSSGLTAGTQYHVGAMIDYAGDSITAYLNGVADGTTGVTFSNATYIHTPSTTEDAIGANTTPPGVSTGQFDGRISELAIWTSNIGPSGFAMVSNCISPTAVSPSTLVFYMRLLGVDSPELSTVSSVTGTITGSVHAADHPCVALPSYRSMLGYWLGGARMPPDSAVVTTVGYRNMLWYWAGGASPTGDGGVTPPVTTRAYYMPTHRARRR